MGARARNAGSQGKYLGESAGRRRFLSASAGFAAGLFVPLSVRAQSSDSIHELRGSVRVNGQHIDDSTVIRAGDLVITGSDGFVMFAIGRDAFFVRERSELRIEPSSLNSRLVSGLRLITGALGSVFGRRATDQVRIVGTTVTAGIRGTGCYLETRGEGNYFCTCFGTIEITSRMDPNDRQILTTSRHDSPQLVLNHPRDGQMFVPAAFETHTDDEMDRLEKCVGRRAPWVKNR